MACHRFLSAAVAARAAAILGILFLSFGATGAPLSPDGARAGSASPTGVWRTANGKSHIRVYRCDEELCGRIVWLDEPVNADGSPKRDGNNPDPALRSRTILGLQILSGLGEDPSKDGRWNGGRIYNPQDGRTYGSRITLLEPDRLEIRGYLGVPLLGGGEVWTRVE